ncbi:hypothetical protein, partial [Siminovitchia terrae]
KVKASGGCHRFSEEIYRAKLDKIWAQIHQGSFDMKTNSRTLYGAFHFVVDISHGRLKVSGIFIRLCGIHKEDVKGQVY